jgi:toxin ParE1/3/4
MPKFILAPEAKADIKAIHDYIAEDNPQAARRVIAIFRDKCRMLANTPMIGRTRDELVQDLRSFPVSNYIIFYRIAGENIEIARILHSAQDLPSLFSE